MEKVIKIWRIWARTMGTKISENTVESDIAALIRTFWWFLHVLTCFFIIANSGRNLGFW
jgi:hypothetical protein